MTNDTQNGYAPFDLYPYNPSIPAAYAFTALFAAVAIAHLAFMIPYRSWFPIPLIIGCAMEAVGYYFRTQSHDNTREILPFLIQNLLILAAPPFLAASVYMSPRRIARVLDCQHIAIKPRLVTKLFVLVDLACFVTQVAGAIMSGSEDPDQAGQGRLTIVVGLVLQIVAFCLFVLWAAALHRGMRSHAPLKFGRIGWQRKMVGLYVISVLFVVRNITRLIEYKQGGDGEILTNEMYLYVLDGLVMLLIILTFLVLHPGRLRYKARRSATNPGGREGYLLERIGSDV